MIVLAQLSGGNISCGGRSGCSSNAVSNNSICSISVVVQVILALVV